MNDPVAFFDPHEGFYWAKPTKITAPVTVDVEPLALYTERTWVGLTIDERIELAQDVDWAIGAYCEYAEKIEAKLKEKNA